MHSVTLTTSIPLARLRQMRMTADAKDESKKPANHDNSLRGAIQGVVCLRRIKHAGLIGRFYWRKDRSNTELAAADADWGASMMSYEGQKETPYMQLMRQGDPNDFGGLDFAQIGMTMGMELDCFNTFLAHSVRDEVTGGYKLNQAFVEIPAPPMATSITLTSLKTIAQTMIHMPVIVTQHDDKPEPPQHVAPKKRVRKPKAEAAAPAEMSESTEDAAPAKSKKRGKKAAEVTAPDAEVTEAPAKKKTRKNNRK